MSVFALQHFLRERGPSTPHDERIDFSLHGDMYESVSFIFLQRERATN